MASDVLADARTGKNGRHALAGLFCESVFGRLAGYEDVNAAGRRRPDPAMRWIVGGKAAQRSAASPSQMGRFETQWLAAPKNFAALADLSGQWIDLVHRRRPPRGIVLDMDSCVSPTHGEQEMSVWNGHYACTCYHPLFVFNQFGDLERCALRAGNVHSADDWDDVLKPVVARYQGEVSRIYFRADAAFAMPEVYEFLEAERIKYAIRTGQPGSAEQDRLSAHAPSRTTSAPCVPVPCQFQLSGRNLDQAAEGYRQGRVASRRTLSPRRLHRHQPVAPGRARRCFLQQARDVRAMDQGGQRRDQGDATVVPNVRRQRGAAPASCTRLQPRQFPAHAGDAGADQGLVADESEGKADQDRRESGEPRPVCCLPDGRGRHPTANVPGDFAIDRGTTTAAATSARVRRRSSRIQKHPTGGVRPNASENSQISPSTIARAARAAGSHPHFASVL